MGILKTTAKTTAVIGAGVITNIFLDDYVLGNQNPLMEVITNAGTAGAVYLTAAKVYADVGVEKILKNTTKVGAQVLGLASCLTDALSSLEIPQKTAALWDGVSNVVSRMAWPIDYITNHTSLKNTNLESRIYNGMSLDGLSNSLKNSPITNPVFWLGVSSAIVAGKGKISSFIKGRGKVVQLEEVMKPYKENSSGLSGFVVRINKAIKPHEENSPELPGLESALDEKSLKEVKDVLDRLEVSNLKKNGVLSSKAVYKTYHKVSGKGLIIKAHERRERAIMESAVNYYLGRNDHLSEIIPKGLYPYPLQTRNLFVTVQEEILHDGKTYDANYWMRAYALLHAHGKSVLDASKIKIPESKSYSFDEVFERIKKHKELVDLRAIKEMGNSYEQFVHELEETRYLIHGDSKKDNRYSGHIVDTEKMGLGNPAIDLSLILCQEGVKENDWSQNLQTYMLAMRKEIGTPFSENDSIKLNKDVKKAKLVTVLREIAGLCSLNGGDIKKEHENEVLHLAHSYLYKQ